MEKVKTFFRSKGLGYWFTLGTTVFLFLSLLAFILLFRESTVIEERPAAVIALISIAIVISLAVGFKDYYNILSIVLFAVTIASFFLFIYGRVSYLAYYFSGDIQGTGLSIWCVISFITLLFSTVSSILGLCFRHTK